MTFETERFTDTEHLADAEAGVESEYAAEYEDPRFETNAISHESESGAHERESGLAAVLEQKGGEASDWSLEYRGSSGYHFDGEQVRDPEGNIWTNADAALHQEMLAQWREGGSSMFFLPDYRVQSAEGEILYVTQLILAETGDVTYEIHKLERLRERESEMAGEGEARAATLTERRHEVWEQSSESRETHVIAEGDMHDEYAAEIGAIEHDRREPDPWLVDLLRSETFSPESPPRGVETSRVESRGSEQRQEQPITLIGMENDGRPAGPEPRAAETILRALGMSRSSHFASDAQQGKNPGTLSRVAASRSTGGITLRSAA